MILFRRVALASFLALLIGGCDTPPKVGDVLVPVATLKLDTPDAVMKLAVSPDGKKVAAILFRSSTMVVVWDVETKRIIHKLPHWYINYHSGIGFTADGKSLLTADYIPWLDQLRRNSDGSVIKDEYGKEILRRLLPEEKFVGHLWNMNTGEKKKSYYYGNDEKSVCRLSSAVFTKDRNEYYQPTRYGIDICDGGTWRKISAIRYPWFNSAGRLVRKTNKIPYLGKVRGVVIDPDRGLALVAVEKVYPAKEKKGHWLTSIVLVWFEIGAVHIIRDVAVTPCSFGYLDVRSMALSRAGGLVAIGTNYGDSITYSDGEKYTNAEPVKIFSIYNGRLVNELPYDDAAQAMAFGIHGRVLFVAHHSLVIWDVSTGEEIGVFNPGGRVLSDMKLSRDGSTLVAGGGNTVYVWSVNRKKFEGR